MRLVDAGVAVEWLVAEEDSDAADRLLAGGDNLYTPRLMASEIANALWRKTRMGEIERGRAGILSAASGSSGSCKICRCPSRTALKSEYPPFIFQGMAIPRKHHLRRVNLLLREFPVVALLGARQVGKSTLARQLVASRRGPTTWFDLENPANLARLADPGLELRPLRGLVVLDEIHRLPDVFPLLRVLADRPRTPARFLVLGSASPDLLRQTSETLAGRVAFHELDGFSLREVDDLERLWLRGGFPLSWLARSVPASRRWRDGFIRTFLARDVPELGSLIPSTTLRRFWTMLAHWHGQLWNGAELGRAFGVSHTTVRRYLDLLTSVFVVRQLHPWYENVGKRQVRSPKVYIGDSGILHALLGLTTREEVVSHPKVGASWEGFVVQQIIHLLAARPEQCFHWSTYSGAELDLLVVAGSRRYGFEVKRSEAPRLTGSMRSAFESLGLDRLDVVHAGTDGYAMAPGVRALPAARLAATLRPLRG